MDVGALKKYWYVPEQSNKEHIFFPRTSSHVALQVKTLSANPDDPGAHMVEKEKWLMQSVL